MTLQTGKDSVFSGSRGFSLIEILLVVALIALGSSILITNFTTFTDIDLDAIPEEVLMAAVRKARFIAAAERITTELYYDDESGTLRIDPTGDEYPLNADFGPEGRGEIRFFLVPPTVGLGRISDPDEANLKSRTVAFAPDRSSSPFVAEIDSGSGSPIRLRFDPFSSVVITGER